MKYFLHIAYKGKAYHGWQRQPQVTSIQSVIEDDLSKMLRTRTTCHCCGRTDSGVNASQFFAHFRVEQAIDFDFVFRINKMLPSDIVVYDLIPVADKANAQLDATRRTYDYFFHFEKNPFLNDLSSFYLCDDLAVDKMQAAVKLIAKQKDFRSMCIKPDLHNHTLCEIYEVNLWLNTDATRMQFQITANRFLREMIRQLAGRLLDIGMGKLSLDEFKNCLATGEKPTFHKAAFPQGLYLSKVDYPYLDLAPKGNFGLDFV